MNQSIAATLEWDPIATLEEASYLNDDDHLLLKNEEGLIKLFSYGYPGGIEGVRGLDSFVPVVWVMTDWETKDSLEDELGYLI